MNSTPPRIIYQPEPCPCRRPVMVPRWISTPVLIAVLAWAGWALWNSN